MQKRDFGKTGLKTSILGFGGFHLLEIPSKEAEYLLNAYLDAGGNYIETAQGYGNGESELKVGKVMKTRRKDCILATKTNFRDSAGCMESLEHSLNHLNTDYIDLYIMHGVGTKEELYKILGPHGAMKAVQKAKEQGKIGFVGISMHGQPDVLIEALHQYEFDAVMSTINYYDRFNFPKIENELIPLATEKGTAIILMKPIADGLLWRSAPDAFRYAMTRPVSVVVTGINTRKMLQEDLEYARRFVPMSSVEEEELFKHAPELGNYVCRQCGRCTPCPLGIPIPKIFKYEGYYDRQMRDGVIRDPAEYALRERLRFWFGNKDMAAEKYNSLDIKGDACSKCGACSNKCPYGIDIPYKLEITHDKLASKKMI